MIIEDFEMLMENCRITADESMVHFTPYCLKDKAHIDKIKQDNGLYNLSFSQFNDLISENKNQYNIRKREREIKLDKYNSMDTKEGQNFP